METKTKQKFSEHQKQTLLKEWKQSGKTKIDFCKEKDLKYFTFVSWKEIKDKKKASDIGNSFLPVKIKKSSDSPFAQLTLKNGAVVKIYSPVAATFLAILVK